MPHMWYVPSVISLNGSSSLCFLLRKTKFSKGMFRSLEGLDNCNNCTYFEMNLVICFIISCHQVLEDSKRKLNRKQIRQKRLCPVVLCGQSFCKLNSTKAEHTRARAHTHARTRAHNVCDIVCLFFTLTYSFHFTAVL